MLGFLFFNFSGLRRLSDFQLFGFYCMLQPAEALLASRIAAETRRCIADILAWDLEVLERGVFPSSDQNKNPWPRGSARAWKIGQNIGVRACFAYWAGDMEAHAKSHSLLRHYNKCSICDWCWATKGDELSCGNFSKTALWRSTCSYHEPLPHREERSVWTAVKGFTKRRRMFDRS